jgi:UMF1 family MFS transporter
VLMLGFFAENAETGRTLLGRAPALGLNPEAREGTRFVGPLTALWYAVFMVPFFLFVREVPSPLGHGGPKARSGRRVALSEGLRQLRETIAGLPARPSLAAYLGASMLYRDALNGIYAFGGLYAAGVLGWSVVDTGVFGLIAIVAGAVFAWLGGRADTAFGPKPVVTVCIAVLTLAAIFIVFVSPTRVLGVPVTEGSRLPDLAFYATGVAIGAAGGALQSASRTLMVRQADPARMTEAFGLYALAGKATSFLAPLSIGIVTSATGSQQWGVTPIIVLFAVGLVLLHWVQPEGDRAE